MDKSHKGSMKNMSKAEKAAYYKMDKKKKKKGGKKKSGDMSYL